MLASSLNLDRLFNPSNLAMIGASAQAGKWGNIILINILKANFKGRVFPVNPKESSILGFPCFASIGDIPEPIDVALITTPAERVSALVDECGRKQVPFLVIVTSGFSEVSQDGMQLEAEIVAKARHYGIRLVGPNTMGLFGATASLHALMPMLMPLQGTVSMFSQSGNVGVQMMDYGQKEGVGFQKFVSSGNEGDLTCVDYLEYFARDEATRVVLGYIEGIDDGARFLKSAQAVAGRKPIIVMKGGRTGVGSRAAASHTGSMAGPIAINRGAFKQAGVVEVLSSLELIDCAKAFANYPIPKGNRVGIVTRGGGWGVITADACEEAGLIVPPLPADLIREIDQLLPDYWNRGNPIDLVATIRDDPMPTCLRLLAEWDGIDAIIALGAGFQSFNYQFSEAVQEPEELVSAIAFMTELFRRRGESPDTVLEGIAALVRSTGKPIISVSIGSDYAHRHYMERYHVVSFPTPERAVRVLKHMCEYDDFTGKIGGTLENQQSGECHGDH
jgi:acyl-CoA synthetase (NDP forming)